MAKFKVGDIVVGNEKANELYGITTEGSRLKVMEVYSDGTFAGKLTYHKTRRWDVSNIFGRRVDKLQGLKPDCFDLFENKKIVITKRDDSVMARLYSAEKLVKEANVDSTGGFDKDAKDAFEELYHPTISPFSFDETKYYYDTDTIKKDDRRNIKMLF